MLKLLVKQASVDYYGFFVSPAFTLIGEIQKILGGLANAFAAHNIGLRNFRLEGDVQDPSTAGVFVNLGRFGTYRFKFDQVQAQLTQFSDDDLEGMVSVIEKGNSWVREAVPDFAFRNHAFVYTSHGVLADRTSSDFLLSLPRRKTPMYGIDLGSGIVETWRDPDMEAKIRITLDHSLQEPDGLFVNYMVVFDCDKINYVDVAHQSRRVLDVFMNELGLEFEPGDVAL